MGMQIAKADGTAGDTSLYRAGIKQRKHPELHPHRRTGQHRVLLRLAALGEKRQALHDIIAKSAVYKKADITA